MIFNPHLSTFWQPSEILLYKSLCLVQRHRTAIPDTYLIDVREPWGLEQAYEAFPFCQFELLSVGDKVRVDGDFS